jgi:osmoprotectant transport system substrate-binding protein
MRLAPSSRRVLARLTCLLAVAACTGCGAAATPSHSTSAAPSRRRPTTTASTTTSASTTTTTTTTTASGAVLPGSGRPPIVVGDKNYTEQFILGQLYVQALGAQGFNVTLNQNIGPPQVTMQALSTGSLSLYPEYVNVFDSVVAGLTPPFDSEAAALAAGRRWAVQHGLGLLAPTPFSDTSGLAVTDAYAQENGLRSIGDLRRVQTALTIGGPPQFQSSDPGLPTLDAMYGLAPSAYKAMAIGGQYGALNSDTVQAADISTTDGQLASGDYAVLADPRHLFGFGNVVPVVSAKVLAAEGPTFADTLDRVDRLLTLPVIRQLNLAVDIAGQNPTAVASQFLETHGLLSPLSP